MEKEGKRNKKFGRVYLSGMLRIFRGVQRSIKLFIAFMVKGSLLCRV